MAGCVVPQGMVELIGWFAFKLTSSKKEMVPLQIILELSAVTERPFRERFGNKSFHSAVHSTVRTWFYARLVVGTNQSKLLWCWLRNFLGECKVDTNHFQKLGKTYHIHIHIRYKCTYVYLYNVCAYTLCFEQLLSLHRCSP